MLSPPRANDMSPRTIMSFAESGVGERGNRIQQRGGEGRRVESEEREGG